MSLYFLVFSLFLCFSLIDFVSIYFLVFSLILCFSLIDFVSLYFLVYTFLSFFALIAFVSIFSGLFSVSFCFFLTSLFASIFSGLVCDFPNSLSLHPCPLFNSLILLSSFYSSLCLPLIPCSNGPIYFVFCRLYPSVPKPPRQYLAPTCHLSTLN